MTPVAAFAVWSVLAWSSAVAVAQDRFVDAVHGDDVAGDGSAEHPWRTITFGSRQGAARRLLVRPGVYDAALGELFPIVLRGDVDLVGADAATTIVRADHGHGVLEIRGSVQPIVSRIANLTITRETPSGADDSYEFGIYAGSYQAPVDLEVSHCVLEDGFDGVSIGADRGSPWIHDCVVRNTSYAGISVTATGLQSELTPRIERNVVEGNRRRGLSLFAYWPQLYPPNFDYPGLLRPLVTNNVISGNVSGIHIAAGFKTFVDYDYYGGRVDGFFDRNRVENNRDTGIDCHVEAWAKLAPMISNTLVQGSHVGIAVSSQYTGSYSALETPTFVNVTVTANDQAGVRARSADHVRPTIVNSIVFGNADDVVNVNPTFIFYSDVGEVEATHENDNFDVDPLFANPAGGDFHPSAASPCIDMANRARAFLATGLDLDGSPRDFDGNHDGFGNPDVGALEYAPPADACRRGNVDALLGFVRDVLFVNGSAGDVDRVVVADLGQPLHVLVAAPHGGPFPASFAMFVFTGEPTADSASPQPDGIGTMCFPTPLGGVAAGVTTLMSNFRARGIGSRLGAPRRPSSPAPFETDIPSRFVRPGMRVTIQGLIANSASPEGRVAITNAVVVRTR
jgi:uncharacterized protein DUF1565